MNGFKPRRLQSEQELVSDVDAIVLDSTQFYAHFFDYLDSELFKSIENTLSEKYL